MRVRLTVLDVGDEAQQRVASGRKIHRDEHVPALRESRRAAEDRGSRTDLSFVDPEQRLGCAFPRRQSRDHDFMRASDWLAR